MKRFNFLTTKLFATIFLLLFSNFFYAFVVVDLYNISTLKEQDGKKLDNDALLTLGLNKLLFKLSGKSDFENNEVIKIALQNPKKYLQEYSVVKNREDKLELKQGYNKSSIDALMKEARLPTWGASRPLTMLWIVAEQELGERSLVSDSENSNDLSKLIKENINKASNIRALPIAWPLYDLDERQTVSIKNLWVFDKEEVQSLSSKYRPDEIIMGKIYLEGDIWRIQWLFKDNIYSFESSQDNLPNTMVTSFNNITNLIAQEYSFIANKEESQNTSDRVVYINVDNIDSLDKLTTLTDYLKNIKSIASTSISKIEGNNVILRIDLKTVQEMFLKEIKLENKLISQNKDTYDKKILLYRWNA